MTLKQAQKLYPDAIQAKMKHLPYCMTEKEIINIGECGFFGKEKNSKVLYYRVGKNVSTVISSRQAFKEEKEVNHEKE